ncbi:MAG: hypothetical protein QHH10_11490 [Peptococcaceae bacterium]|jgi:hypothetical protein|nr:hypothetical protein [Peptococcaceae bacterium]MDH7525924.1 hypothetical protein [Peptococcaceae bacterium]
MYPDYPVFVYVRKVFEEQHPDSRIYLVGGSVRDLLRGCAIKDFDFMVEGDAFAVAESLARELGSKLVLNEKLLTASLPSRWGPVDFVRARRETYPFPGALPEVEPAGCEEDLLRRDFTINALALPLLKNGWGEIIDLAGGGSDLQEGLLRVLHENSFRDDPTRILRAIRFKCRLGFRLEKKTRALLQRDWKFLKCVSPARRLKEWQLICQEENISAVLFEIRALGGWPHFFRGLSFNQSAVSGLSDIILPGRPQDFRPWFFFLLHLLAAQAEALAVLADYWGLTVRDIVGMKDTLELLAGGKEAFPLKGREFSRAVKELPPEGVYFLYREWFNGSKRWEVFYQEIKSTSISMPVNGHDLLQLGVRPGPGLGRLLKRLEDYFRAGSWVTREEGIKMARLILAGKEDENNDV